ncbi:hypothetical protein F5887DRAFT_1070128 [Amanita rubescens]|nr:hypothetical protein F5887DRAFT_1070128 [Amanita rubescens]
MALSPDGTINEDYYRQILDHLLRVSLPAEDYAAEVERYIIREAILKLVLVDLLPRVTQPWFIQLVILNQLSSEDQISSYISPKASTSSSLLIMLLSTVQKLSGVSLAIVRAYKQAVSTIKSVNQLPIRKVSSPSQASSSTNTDTSASEDSSPDSVPTPDERLRTTVPEAPPSPATVLPLFLLFSEIFNTTERLASLIITTIIFVMTVFWTSFLDRLAPHLLLTSLSSAFVLNTTRIAKRTLFPNGYPGPPYEDPTPEEQSAIRARLTAIRPTGVLAYLVPIVLGSDPTATLDAAIEPLCNSRCNLHLAVAILDRILVGLCPELVHPEGNPL